MMSQFRKDYLNEWIQPGIAGQFAVVGHTREQVHRWARLHRLQKQDFIEITRVEQLMGYVGVVILLPFWERNREQYDKIWELLTYDTARGHRHFMILYGRDE